MIMEKAGIVCCSNGLQKSSQKDLQALELVLKGMGLEPVYSPYLYAQEHVWSGTARQRADALMEFYRDEEIRQIFDVSGGDLANGILPYLDYAHFRKVISVSGDTVILPRYSMQSIQRQADPQFFIR